MRLRKRERNAGSTSVGSLATRSSSSSLGPPVATVSSSSSATSTSTSSFVGTSSKRAGKAKPSTRGRSRASKKILSEKHDSNEEEVDLDSTLLKSMAEIFQKCQNLQYQEECIQKMKDIYHNAEHAEFCKKLHHFIRIVFRNDPKSPFTKNCLAFIARLIATLDNEKRGVDLKEDETHDELGESIFGEEVFNQVTPGSHSVIETVLSELLKNEFHSFNVEVRKNACSLVTKLIYDLSDLSQTIYSELVKVLLDRLADRNYIVRSSAAYALRRFQEPGKPKDQVFIGYGFHLLKDPAFQVRNAVLASLEPVLENLELVIKCTRNDKAIIRKHAYTKLAEQYKLSSFSPEQRISILKDGLGDRHPSVRRTVEEKLLKSWLKECDDDLINFLSELSVKSDAKTIEKILKIFCSQLIETGDEKFGTRLHFVTYQFRNSYLDEQKLLKEEHLTIEKVFTWQCLNKFIKSNEDRFIKLAEKNFAKEFAKTPAQTPSSSTNAEDMAEATTVAEEWAQTLTGDGNATQEKDDSHIADYLFPELPHLCQYLQKFVDSIDSLADTAPDGDGIIDEEFIYNQLVSILILFDCCDEAQQNYILEMIKTIIFSDSLPIYFQDSISPMMKFLALRIFKDPDHLIEFTTECTSKVYNLAAEVSVCENSANTRPLEPSGTEPTYDAEYARLTIEMEELRDQLDQAHSNRAYIVANEIQTKFDALKSERDRLQALRMAQKSTQSQQIPPSQVPCTQQAFDITNHPQTLLKCLQIFVGALENGKFETANTLIYSHITQIVLKGVIIEDEKVRPFGVKALGLCCFLSASLFQEHCNLLLQIVKHDNPKVKVIALHGFFDSLCRHGIEPLLRKTRAASEPRRTSRRRIEEDIANLSLQTGDLGLLEMSGIGDAETQAELQRSMMEQEDYEDEEESENEAERSAIEHERSRFFEILNKNSEPELIESLINLLVDRLLANEEDEIVETSIEGFAKLMILGIVYSPPLLSRLIITWYMPDTRPKITQFLGVFLPIYVCSESKYVREDDQITVTGQICLVDCFIDTLEILFEAKHGVARDPEELRLFQYLPYLPEDAQYRSIDLKNVMNFMLSLIKPNHHKQLFSYLIHKMFAIVAGNDQEFRFYEDFLSDYLLKAVERLSLIDIDENVFTELRPVMNQLITRMKSRISDMLSARRKKFEIFIRDFLSFIKSLGRGELNLSAASHEGDGLDPNPDQMEEDELNLDPDQIPENSNLDPIGSMPGSSDESKENNDEAGSDGEKEKPDDDLELGEEDEDELDNLSELSETLRWSDIEDNET